MWLIERCIGGTTCAQEHLHFNEVKNVAVSGSTAEFWATHKTDYLAALAEADPNVMWLSIGMCAVGVALISLFTLASNRWRRHPRVLLEPRQERN